MSCKAPVVDEKCENGTIGPTSTLEKKKLHDQTKME